MAKLRLCKCGKKIEPAYLFDRCEDCSVAHLSSTSGGGPLTQKSKVIRRGKNPGGDQSDWYVKAFHSK